ncbi:MAG: type II 3-dehydroquinate dehydratase [Gemmatimonadota bacterium]
MRIGVLHGPNLNLLGRRDPARYGTATLAGIDESLRARAEELRVTVEPFQSNHEGALVDHVERRSPELDGWLVNAAGLTHTSVALRDALESSGLPFVEVHLSNVHAREEFRRRSLLADLAVGVVAGFRERSYLYGLDGLVARLRETR